MRFLLSKCWTNALEPDFLLMMLKVQDLDERAVIIVYKHKQHLVQRQRWSVSLFLKNRCPFSAVTSHIGVKEENLPLIDVSFFSFHVSGAATHLKGTDKLSFLTQTPASGKWTLKKRSVKEEKVETW